MAADSSWGIGECVITVSVKDPSKNNFSGSARAGRRWQGATRRNSGGISRRSNTASGGRSRRNGKVVLG